MSRHTPGPWKISLTINGNPTITSKDGKFIASLGQGHSDMEIKEANGRLIACAPEMLAALHIVIEFLRYSTKNPNDDPKDVFVIGKMAQIVLAAIAKAEGKE